MQDVYNSIQAAEYLHITRHVLYLRIKMGKLEPLPRNPALGKTQRLYFSKDALDAIKIYQDTKEAA